MNVRNTLQTLIITALLATTLVGCGRAPMSGVSLTDEVFAEMDIDGDGRLSRTEAGLPSISFDRLDRNHDGFLTPLEWRSAAQSSDNALQAQRITDFQRDLKKQ